MNVLAYIQERELNQRVKTMLDEAGYDCKSALYIHAALTTAQRDMPAVVVMDESAANQAGGHFASVAPDAGRILLQTTRDAKRTIQAMREGYSVVLLVPEELNQLPDAVARLSLSNAENAREGRRNVLESGWVMAITSAAGGSGRSTVAAHVAISMAARNIRTLLIDLSFHNGSLRHLFNVEATHNLSDLLPVLDELNEAHIQNAVTPIGRNVDLLGAPLGGDETTLTDEETRQLLHVCSRMYGAVVVDLPANMNSCKATTLRMATQALYLLTPDPAGAWSLTSALAQWDHWEIPRDRLILVLNHRTPTMIALQPDKDGRLFTLPIGGKIGFDQAAPFADIAKTWATPNSLVGIAADVDRLVAQLIRSDAQPQGPQRGGVVGQLVRWVSGSVPEHTGARRGR